MELSLLPRYEPRLSPLLAPPAAVLTLPQLLLRAAAAAVKNITRSSSSKLEPCASWSKRR